MPDSHEWIGGCIGIENIEQDTVRCRRVAGAGRGEERVIGR